MKNKKQWLLIGFLVSLTLGMVYDLKRPTSKPSLPEKHLTEPQLAIVKKVFSSQPKIEVEIALNMEKVFEKKIADMSLEEKVGQLFLARVPEKKQLEDIKDYHLGGYLLFSRDIAGETPKSLKKKIESYQKKAKLPLIIASDEEGGLVSRLSYEDGFLKEKFAAPQKIYQAGGLPGIKKDLKAKADVLHDLGISMTLAPVADVSTDSSSFIYERTLGKDTAETTRYIETVVTEMKDLKIGSTLKHFPGYGDNRDSHLEIVHDDRSLAELKKESLPPFIKGIEAGADSVLISHNIVSAIDPDSPASISEKVYDLLRDELSFKGVIMTDDFDMAGLKEFTSQEEAAVKAFDSSADLILSSSYQTQIPAVIKAVKAKKLPEAKIDQSLTRVLTLKYQLGLLEID